MNYGQKTSKTVEIGMKRRINILLKVKIKNCTCGYTIGGSLAI